MCDEYILFDQWEQPIYGMEDQSNLEILIYTVRKESDEVGVFLLLLT